MEHNHQALQVYLAHKQLPSRDKKSVAPKDDKSIQIDDSIYKLPDQPDLELGDGLINTLGVEANDLLNSYFITKQEENDVILEQIK